MWRVSSIPRLAGLRKPVPLAAAANMARGLARGTAVHAFGEAYAFGEAVPVPDGASGYVEAMRKWFVDFQPVVLFAERRVVNRRMRLTGRPDLGVLLGGVPWIIDWKNGEEEPWHAIQTVGYCDLANNDADMLELISAHQFGGPGSKREWRRACVHLQANGKPIWSPYVNPQDAYLFRSALALVQWRFDHGVLDYTDPERPDDDGRGAVPEGGAGAAGEGSGAPDPNGG